MRALLLVVAVLKTVHCISPETKQLVEDWAPLVWLHSEEPFYPSTAEFHLENVQVNNENDELVQSNPTLDGIVTGPETGGYHLNTMEPMSCVNCFQPFFSGQSLNESKVYTFVTEHEDDCSTVDVSYTFFYPFNYGKDVCVGLEEFGICFGEVRTFGNHVGDWEKMSIRFQNGFPLRAYLDVHNFGAWYDWNGATSRFDFAEGKPVRRSTMRDGKSDEIRIVVEYPEFLDLVGGRPEIFSANGSHGVWSQPGKHTYVHILTVHLDDYTERGENWNTWEHLKIYETGDLASFTGNDSWINFGGLWGNTHKLECELDPLIGECGLVGGPLGPQKYFNHDFEQPPPFMCGKSNRGQVSSPQDTMKFLN